MKRLGREWTADEDEKIKRLAADGYSASQIAAEMNERSRNAVIGRLNRIGARLGDLCSPGQPRKPTGKPKKPRNQPARIAVTPRAKQLFSPLPASEAFIALETSTPVGLMDLKDGQCKWPVGELYCGNATDFRKVYCAKHQATARRPPMHQHTRRSSHKYW